MFFYKYDQNFYNGFLSCAGPVPMALISWTSSRNKANSSCVQLANEHETQLKNLTLVNILILVVLIIVFIANAKEGKKIMFPKNLQIIFTDIFGYDFPTLLLFLKAKPSNS